MGVSQILTVGAAAVSDEPAVGVVVATGLIIVFGVLVLLFLLITLQGIIFTAIDNKKKGVPTQQKKASAPAQVSQKPAAHAAKASYIEPGIPAEVVAAISAAVAAMDGGSRYMVRSLTRAKQGRAAWSQAGVISYTEPF